jgi:hypothetical protein
LRDAELGNKLLSGTYTMTVAALRQNIAATPP